MDGLVVIRSTMDIHHHHCCHNLNITLVKQLRDTIRMNTDFTINRKRERIMLTMQSMEVD